MGSKGIIRSTSLRLGQIIRDPGSREQQVLGAVEATRPLQLLMGIVNDLAQARLDAEWSRKHLFRTADNTEHPHAYKKLFAVAGKNPRLAAHRGYINSRIGRMADERAGSLLISQGRGMRLLDAIIKGEPHEYITTAEYIGLKEEIDKARTRSGKALRSAFTVRPQPPQLKVYVLNFAASDGQYHKVRVDETTATVEPGSSACEPGHTAREYVITLKLPMKPQPTKTDWIEHELRFPLTDQVREGATLKAATLRLDAAGRVYLHLPMSLPKLDPLNLNPGLVFAADWGWKTMLTGGFVRHEDDAYRTDGRPHRFHVNAWQEKNARRARRANAIHKKIKHWEALSIDPLLNPKYTALEVERRLLWDKVGHVNCEIAVLAARWTVDTALAQNCSIIAVEDLSTMKAQKLGRFLNGRLAMQARGAWVKVLTDLCEELGLELRIVPPRGTSSQCSGCGQRSKFFESQQSSQRGRTWLRCSCGRSMNRDHNAAVNIAVRGLSGAADTASTPIVQLTRTRRRKRIDTQAQARRQRGLKLSRRKRHSRDKNHPTSRGPRGPRQRMPLEAAPLAQSQPMIVLGQSLPSSRARGQQRDPVKLTQCWSFQHYLSSLNHVRITIPGYGHATRYYE